MREQLEQIVTAASEVPELRELLRNPQLDPRTRAAALEEIAGEFERLVSEEEGILTADLTTAVELSDEDERRLLKQIEEASGRKVEATRQVDPDLIGGIVLQVGSHRLDASVRGRLDQLRRALAGASS